MQELPSIRRVLLALVLSSLAPILSLAFGLALVTWAGWAWADIEHGPLQYLLLIAGSLTGVTVALAWRAASRITDAMEALSAAVRAAGEAHALELPPPRFMEEQHLAQALIYANTALRDTHEALRAKEARLRIVLDTARDAIVTTDEDGKIVLFNRAAARLFGIDEHEAIGRSLDAFLPQEQRGRHLAQMREMNPNSAAPRMMGPARVVRALRSDGSRFPVNASISCAMDGDRRLYTAILREVAEGKLDIDVTAALPA